jgi:hypothetical protein
MVACDWVKSWEVVRCGRFYAVVETRPSVGGARRFVALWGYFRRRRLRARLFEGSTVASTAGVARRRWADVAERDLGELAQAPPYRKGISHTSDRNITAAYGISTLITHTGCS